VTVDGYWIDNWIYWINSYNTWLHFTVSCNTHALIFLVLVGSHVLSPLSWPPNQDCNSGGPVHPHNCNSSLQADFFITQLTESSFSYLASCCVCILWYNGPSHTTIRNTSRTLATEQYPYRRRNNNTIKNNKKIQHGAIGHQEDTNRITTARNKHIRQ
jgi:hypothetical protein